MVEPLETSLEEFFKKDSLVREIPAFCLEISPGVKTNLYSSPPIPCRPCDITLHLNFLIRNLGAGDPYLKHRNLVKIK